jgi:hypothetical protein
MAAATLNYIAYDFIKIRRTLRVSPAMTADVTDHLREESELIGLSKSNAKAKIERAAYTMKNIVEGTMLIIAIAGVIGGIWNRIKLVKGIGVRFIQYLGVTLVLPVIAVLSLEDRISQEMTGGIFIAVVGGLLASVGKDE